MSGIPNPPVAFGVMTEEELVKSDLLRMGFQPRFFEEHRQLSVEQLCRGCDKIQSLFDTYGIDPEDEKYAKN